MNKMEAQILCISRTALKKCGIDNGYYADNEGELINKLLADYSFKTRGPLESDDAYVQPIPYIVFIGKQTGKILSYRRHSDAERNNESRLYGKRSIGIGGHIEQHELSGTKNNPLVETALRETEEELRITIHETDLLYQGLIFINHPSTVDYYHLGVVYRVNIEESSLAQTGEFDTQFLSAGELMEAGEKQEIEIEPRSKTLLPLFNNK